MAGKIWYYDCYDLRKFGINDIHTFVDIGANNGSVSMMAKILMPSARIIAIEPCKESFENFKNNIWCWRKIRIEGYNIALGDGSQLYLHKNKRYDGLHKFFTDTETKDFNVEKEDSVQSRTLKQIFDDYEIDISLPYILKIDCEGGERFLLEQEDSLDILRNATQIMFELHIGIGGSGEEWNEFLQRITTHEIKYGKYEPDGKSPDRKFVYKRISKFEEKSGRHTVELVKKNTNFV